MLILYMLQLLRARFQPSKIVHAVLSFKFHDGDNAASLKGGVTLHFSGVKLLPLYLYLTPFKLNKSFSVGLPL